VFDEQWTDLAATCRGIGQHWLGSGGESQSPAAHRGLEPVRVEPDVASRDCEAGIAAGAAFLGGRLAVLAAGTGSLGGLLAVRAAGSGSVELSITKRKWTFFPTTLSNATLTLSIGTTSISAAMSCYPLRLLDAADQRTGDGGPQQRHAGEVDRTGRGVGASVPSVTRVPSCLRSEMYGFMSKAVGIVDSRKSTDPACVATSSSSPRAPRSWVDPR
jgi:hypothetical protein